MVSLLRDRMVWVAAKGDSATTVVEDEGATTESKRAGLSRLSGWEKGEVGRDWGDGVSVP